MGKRQQRERQRVWLLFRRLQRSVPQPCRLLRRKLRQRGRLRTGLLWRRLPERSCSGGCRRRVGRCQESGSRGSGCAQAAEEKRQLGMPLVSRLPPFKLHQCERLRARRRRRDLRFCEGAGRTVAGYASCPVTFR